MISGVGGGGFPDDLAMILGQGCMKMHDEMRFFKNSENPRSHMPPGTCVFVFFVCWAISRNN